MRALQALLHDRFGGLPRPFWWLCLGVLGTRAGAFVQPLLSYYLTQGLGMGLQTVSLLLALSGLASAAGATAGGVVADRLGRRRALLISAGLTALLALLLGQVGPAPAIWLAVPALFLAFDLHRPAVQAMLADLVPAADRVRAFSILYVSVNLGFAAASAIAGWLARLSYPLLFAAAAGVQLLWAAFVWLRLPESRPSAAAELSGGDAGSVVQDRVYMGFLAVVGLLTLLPHQGGLALTAWVASQGHSPATYGSLLGLNGLLIVLLQPWAGAPLGRLDPPRTFCAGALLYGLGFWGHGLARSPTEHALAVLLWTLGEVVVTPVIAGTSAALAPPALRGRYQGLLGMSFSVAGAAAPLLGGALLSQGQGALLWRGCMALGLGAGLGMLALGPALRGRLSRAADPTGSPP